MLGKGAEIGELLESHDVLHQRLIQLEDDELGAHTPADHERLNDEIRTNVLELWRLLGMSGLRGLVHVGFEMLDTAAHLGLGVNDEGDFLDRDQGASYMALVADVRDLDRLIGLIGFYSGKIPPDHEAAAAAMDAEAELSSKFFD